MDFSANFAGAPATEAESHKCDNQSHQHREEDRSDEDIREEGIHVSSETGGLLREKWQR
jgi:hypothetical protein